MQAEYGDSGEIKATCPGSSKTLRCVDVVVAVLDEVIWVIENFPKRWN